MEISAEEKLRLAYENGINPYDFDAVALPDGNVQFNRVATTKTPTAFGTFGKAALGSLSRGLQGMATAATGAQLGAMTGIGAAAPTAEAAAPATVPLGALIGTGAGLAADFVAGDAVHRALKSRVYDPRQEARDRDTNPTAANLGDIFGMLATAVPTPSGIRNLASAGAKITQLPFFGTANFNRSANLLQRLGSNTKQGLGRFTPGEIGAVVPAVIQSAASIPAVKDMIDRGEVDPWALGKLALGIASTHATPLAQSVARLPGAAYDSLTAPPAAPRFVPPSAQPTPPAPAVAESGGAPAAPLARGESAVTFPWEYVPSKPMPILSAEAVALQRAAQENPPQLPTEPVNVPALPLRRGERAVRFPWESPKPQPMPVLDAVAAEFLQGQRDHAAAQERRAIREAAEAEVAARPQNQAPEGSGLPSGRPYGSDPADYPPNTPVVPPGYRAPKFMTAEAPEADPAVAARGRALLTRQGFRVTEPELVPQPPDVPAGSRVIGSQGGRDIALERGNPTAELPYHEGAHGVVAVLSNHPDETVRKGVADMLTAFIGEEPLATAAGKAGVVRAREAAVWRFVRDSWNNIAATFGDASPVRAARYIAEELDRMRPVTDSSFGPEPSAPKNMFVNPQPGDDPRRIQESLYQGRPLYEVDDSGFQYTMPKRVGGLIRMSHPELEKRGIKLPVAFAVPLRGATGTYDPIVQAIAVDPSSTNPRNTLLHEMQHYIQGIQNHPSKGSSIDFERQQFAAQYSFKDFRKDPELGFALMQKMNPQLTREDFAERVSTPEGAKQAYTMLQSTEALKNYLNNGGERHATLAGNRGHMAAEDRATYRPLNFMTVPNSVTSKVVDFYAQGDPVRSAEADKAVGGFYTDANRWLPGKLLTPIDRLFRDTPSAVADSALAKRRQAYVTGTTPQYTPEEAAFDVAVDPLIKAFVDVNNAAPNRNRMMTAGPNYVPDTPAASFMRRVTHGTQADHDMALKRFIDYNINELKSSEPPEAIAEYFTGYMNAASHGRGFGDFNPFVKAQRQFYFPPEFLETSAQATLSRYGHRAVRELAKIRNLNGTQFAAETGLDREPAQFVSANPAVRNFAEDVFNTRNPETFHAAFQVIRALQTAATRAAVGPVSGVANIMQSLKDHAVHGGPVSYLRALLTAAANPREALGEAQNAGAARVNVGRSALPDDNDIAMRVATRILDAADAIGKYTGANALENTARTIDYQHGKILAEAAIRNGDADFINRFSNGIDPADTPEDRISKMAGNYVARIQSTYSGEDLPAALAKSGKRQLLFRIMRFGVANFNRTVEDVMKPAARGNFTPLIKYLAVGTLATKPLLEGLDKVFNIPNYTPTKEELDITDADTLERTLAVMESADRIGFAGAAGQILGKVAKNYNGGHNQLVGDPLITALIGNIALNGAAAAQDIIDGAEPTAAIVDAFNEALTKSFQVLGRGSRLMATEEDIRENAAKRDTAVAERLGGRPKTDLQEVLRRSLVPFSDRVPNRGLVEDFREGRVPVSPLPIKTIKNTLSTASEYPGFYAPGSAPEKAAFVRDFVTQIRGEDEFNARLRDYQARRLAAARTAAQTPVDTTRP